MMSSSSKSGQTRLASSDSGWRTSWEKVVGEASKRRERERAATAVNGGGGQRRSVASDREASIKESIYVVHLLPSRRRR